MIFNNGRLFEILSITSIISYCYDFNNMVFISSYTISLSTDIKVEKEGFKFYCSLYLFRVIAIVLSIS